MQMSNQQILEGWSLRHNFDLTKDFYHGKIPMSVARAYLQEYCTVNDKFALSNNPTVLKVLNFHRMQATLFSDYNMDETKYPLGGTNPHVQREWNETHKDYAKTKVGLWALNNRSHTARFVNNLDKMLEDRPDKVKQVSFFHGEASAREWVRRCILEGKLTVEGDKRQELLHKPMKSAGSVHLILADSNFETGTTGKKYDQVANAVHVVFHDKITKDNPGFHGYPKFFDFTKKNDNSQGNDDSASKKRKIGQSQQPNQKKAKRQSEQIPLQDQKIARRVQAAVRLSAVRQKRGPQSSQIERVIKKSYQTVVAKGTKPLSKIQVALQRKDAKESIVRQNVQQLTTKVATASQQKPPLKQTTHYRTSYAAAKQGNVPKKTTQVVAQKPTPQRTAQGRIFQNRTAQTTQQNATRLRAAQLAAQQRFIQQRTASQRATLQRAAQIAAQLKLGLQRAAGQRAAQQRAIQGAAQQRAALQRASQQRAAQLVTQLRAAQQRAAIQRASQQRVAQAIAQQRAATQRASQLRAAQLVAQQRALQQRAAIQRASQQRVAQAIAQQRAATQRASQLRAAQLLAQQRAAQQRAALQRSAQIAAQQKAAAQQRAAQAVAQQRAAQNAFQQAARQRAAINYMNRKK